MNKIIKRFGVVVICFALLCFGVVNAEVINFAAKVANGTMKNADVPQTNVAEGDGYVQFIHGNPSNLPSGIASEANSYLTGTDSYATALEEPFTGQDIKGKVGDHTASAGAGGFFLYTEIDAPQNDNYYVRYFTEEQPDGFTYYGNSTTKTPYTGGIASPFTEGFDTFTLYKAAPPPLPTAISAVLTGYTANPVTLVPDKPIIDLAMTVDLLEYQVNNYEFQVQEIDPEQAVPDPIGAAFVLPASGKSLQDKTNFNLNSSYLISARVQNNFPVVPGVPAWGPAVPERLDIGGLPEGEISVDYDLIAGIQQFAIYVDPTKDDFKVNNAALAANNIDSFIQALNAANNITTFGWWDSVEQQPVGYIITWAAGGPPQYEAVNGAPAATGTALAKDKVYQLALNNALSFNIKGTR